MKKEFVSCKQATVDICVSSDNFIRNAPFEDENIISIANLRYVPVMDFELDALKGTKITGADLYLQLASDDYPLEVEITTITQDWNSRNITCQNPDINKTWLNGRLFTDVIMGNGHSRYFRSKTEYDDREKLLKIHIPREVVYSLIYRQSYGFGLIDAKSKAYRTSQWVDWDIIKYFNVDKNEGNLPRLEVEFESVASGIPGSVTSFSGLGFENAESLDYAGVVLTWQPPRNTEANEYLYYNIRFSEDKLPFEQMQQIPQYFIPVVEPEKWINGTEVLFLKLSTNYWFAVSVSNGIEASRPVYTKVKTMARKGTPTLTIKSKAVKPAEEQKVSGLHQTEPFSIGSHKVYVLDEISRNDPVSGKIYKADKETGIMKPETPLDSYACALLAADHIGFDCTNGETAAFQLIFSSNEAIESKLEIKAEGIPDGVKISLYKMWYVNSEGFWYPEVAIPLTEDGNLDLPFSDNKIPDQKYQSILVEVIASPKIENGYKTFTLSVISGTAILKIPVKLLLSKIRLDPVDFIVELNGYVNPPNYMGVEYGQPDYEALEKEYYKTGAEHHMTVDILPYSHFGTVQEGCLPEIEFVNGLPRVTDWSSWDAHYEKYLNGSYMESSASKSRKPVTHIYLPFFENWPMSVNEYYTVKVEQDKYPELINEHKIKASTPFQDFLPAYREGMKSVLKDFIRHIDEKGWRDVLFLYFLNNKHFYKEKDFLATHKLTFAEMWLTARTCGNDGNGTSWWILDEPVFRDDWEALYFFGSILREAQDELNSGNNVKFRVDIYSYNCLFNFLDGVLDMSIICDSESRRMRETIRERKSRYGEVFWLYGGWNQIHRSNMSSCLWLINSYLNGASGMVPWNNYALDDNYETSDNTACLYPGNRFGIKKPLVSLRLKSGRKALELIRYLDNFKKCFNYNMVQLRSYVESFIGPLNVAVSLPGEDSGMDREKTDGQLYMELEKMRKDILERLKVKISI